MTRRPKVAVATGGLVLAALGTTVGALSRSLGRSRREVERRTAELRDLRAEAADEREGRAQEAERRRALEVADNQRSAVLRSVSHDLRTPLATILSVTSDLRSGTAYDEATRNELLDIVGDEAQRLDRLVANLLSMSRLEAGAMTLQRQAVDLGELVRERVRRLGRLFHQVRLVVDVPDDLPLIDGDYSSLDQLVTNLLENAARYAPARSMLTIAASARTDGTVQLMVQDEGVGIPDYERTQIFDPFRKGSDSRSSGLGLAICRGIAEAHGGRIWVDRTPGGGATFFVTLPTRKVRTRG